MCRDGGENGFEVSHLKMDGRCRSASRYGVPAWISQLAAMMRYPRIVATYSQTLGIRAGICRDTRACAKLSALTFRWRQHARLKSLLDFDSHLTRPCVPGRCIPPRLVLDTSVDALRLMPLYYRSNTHLGSMYQYDEHARSTETFGSICVLSDKPTVCCRMWSLTSTQASCVLSSADRFPVPALYIFSALTRDRGHFLVV